MTMSSANLSESGASDAQNQPAVTSRRIFRQLTAPKKLEPAATASGSPRLAAPVAAGMPVVAQPRQQRQLQFMPAFWTVSGLISLTINIILIVGLIGLANQLFTLKAVLKDQLIGGLVNNFALMDQAHIVTQVKIDTQVPASFSLPLDTDTSVTLTKDTPIKTARVTLATGGLQIINAPTNIILPAGTVLPIHLSLSVPVDQQIPVVLNVPIDIPLAQTELHKPFAGLQDVVRPYQNLLSTIPGTWREILCGPKPSDICLFFIP